MKKPSQIGFACMVLLIFLSLIIGCKEENLPTSPVAPIEQSILTGRQRIHGYWKLTNQWRNAKFLIADTLASRFIMLTDQGFSFRSAIDSRVTITDSSIHLSSKIEPWLYYAFNSTSDSLFISVDSSLSHPGIAVIDSTPSGLTQWLPVLTYSKKRFFRTVTRSSLDGADRFDGHWYLRYRQDTGSILEIRDSIGGDTLKSITFPNITTCDIAGGYLWLAGSYFLEKRSIPDTALISRIDLTENYSFDTRYSLRHLAVADSVFCVYFAERFLRFRTNGQFLSEAETYDGVWCMISLGDQFVVGTNSSTLHTVDVISGLALSSFLLPEGLYGNQIHPPVGIVQIGDGLGAFRQIAFTQGMDLFEFSFPQ